MKIEKKRPGENARMYAHRIILDNIINLELPPGSAISENDLSVSLNLSRTPVREALIEMTRLDLVKIYPQKGSFVSKIDYDLIEESKFIRLSLELAALRLLCEQGIPADVLAHVDADAHRPCAEIFLPAQRRLLLPRPQRRLLHRIPAVILLAQHGAGHMVECSLNRAHLFDPCCFVHSVPFSPDKFSVKPASPSGTMRKLVKSAHGAKYRQMDG